VTPTATPLATPTATAVPLTIAGNPRVTVLHSSVPQANVPCGLVDTLDFPIDPPDVATVSRGGDDFSVFRSHYDQCHAGEDWGGPTGQPNLGTPVQETAAFLADDEIIGVNLSSGRVHWRYSPININR
jgi:hypothetical protein